MELYQLRQFRMVARYENMTQAARELCVAQPALSKTIRNLERELAHGVEHDWLRLIHLEGAPCLRTIYFQRRGGYAPKNLPLLEAHLSEYFAGLRP